MFLARRYSHFFISPLRQYFKDFNYDIFEDFPSLERVKNASHKDYLKWVKIHKEYLTANESLTVGLALFYEQKFNTDSEFEKIVSYFEYSINSSENDEIHYLAKLSLGIIYFNSALASLNEKKQSKLIKISRFYFNEAANHTEANELALLYRALTEVGVGEIEEACRYITKASRSSQDPSFLFQVLHKVYNRLGFESISTFYQTKAMAC